MIRRKADQKIEFKCIRNGNGDAELHGITNSVEELYGKGRLFEHMFLAPGRSIGEHTHVGDNEIFEVNGWCELPMRPYSARILVVNDGSFRWFR